MTTPVLADLLADGIDLFCWCNTCSHNTVVSIAQAIARYGADWPALRVLAKRTACSSTDVDVKLD